MPGLRIFAAVVPPADAVAHLDDFLEPRRSAVRPQDPALRWTPREQFHVTCAFMPKVEDWRVDEYVDHLADALMRLTVPVLRIAGPVAFPNAGQAQVLGTGVVAEAEGSDVVLQRIAGKTRSAAVKSGIEVEGRRFRAHVTIARMRPTEASNWVRLLETYVGPEWPATEVEVISSHLGEGPRRRPRYETLARVPVGR